MRISPITLPAAAALLLALTAQAQVTDPALTNPNPKTPTALPLTGAVQFTHDPSIARDGQTYYVFATGKAPEGGQFPIRCSEDLKLWRRCGHVFDAIPAWIRARSPGTEDLWAPDISHEHGEFRLYYAYSLFGKNTSGIALATNKTLDPSSPDYKWVDKGLVLESLATDNFNAIDPNYIEDAAAGASPATHSQPHAWLAFGSFWGGIQLRALDAGTGLASNTDTQFRTIAARARPAVAEPPPPGLPANWQAVEAPFLIHHGDFFYLFVSWDLCCRGTKSTYRTMVGRATTITGPYLDRNGVDMAHGGGSPLLTANARWLGPGGESVLTQAPGPDLLVFHAYDATTGKPSLQISTIAWQDNWPTAALADH